MELQFVFPLAAGLHARPAGLVQEQVSRFRSEITLANNANGAVADARSTLALVATVTERGDPCTFRIEGEDEGWAFVALKRFVEDVLPHADDGMSSAPVFAPEERWIPRVLRGAPALTGNPVSPGLALGHACVLSALDPFAVIPLGPAGPPAEEEAVFQRAVNSIAGEIEQMLQKRPGGTRSAILRAHLSILRDHGFAVKVSELLAAGTISAGRATTGAARHFEEIFRHAGSAYLQERAEDIRDIAGRLVTAMYGAGTAGSMLGEEAVCVADNLSPSEYLSLDRRYLMGLVLARGGTTSHTVILARAEGIPCITGVQEAHRRIGEGEEIILDARRGLVLLRPVPEVRRFYEIESHTIVRREAAVAGFISLPGVTADGKKLEVAANAASLGDVQAAFRNGAEGIGLFRTEMLFADRAEPPGEDEQTAVCTAAVLAANGKPVIFRTLDAGGDKPLRYLPLLEEENPSLGYRAIRMYEDFSTVIDTQIRAILRASAHGPVKIILPMISGISELRAQKMRVQRCTAELVKQGIPCDAAISVGIMVEVPSVLFQMDLLSAEADFFSIGSNDLTQYLLAVDRGNDKVEKLYSSWHPSLLRSLQLAVQGAHRHGRWVGICGEMAGWERALPLFVGLGIDEISVTPRRIPWLKAALRGLTSADCVEVTAAALAAETPEDAERLLGSYLLDLARFGLTDAGLVRLDSPAGTKGEVIRELVSLLEAAGRIDDADLTEEDVWQREDTAHTGVGYSIALPHCRSGHVRAASIAVLKTAAPVPWNSGGEPVALAILIAVPEGGGGDDHLKIIARLARKLVHEEFRAGLMSAQDPEAVIRLLERETAV